MYNRENNRHKAFFVVQWQWHEYQKPHSTSVGGGKAPI